MNYNKATTMEFSCHMLSGQQVARTNVKMSLKCRCNVFCIKLGVMYGKIHV